MTRCLVLIPAYNEAAAIGRVVSDVWREARGFDVLVIDDGSRDATASIASANGAAVVSHPYNLGYGLTLKTGYKYAVRHGYDLVVQMDADGQHDPSEVNRLAAPVLEGEADLAIGSRFHDESHYRMPTLRRIGSRWFATLVRLSTGLTIRDPTSGLQALSRSVLEFYDSDVFPEDYPDADMLVLLHRNGFRIREVPVVMHEHSEGQSMHAGLSVLYYVYKMTLAILMNLFRPPVRHCRGDEGEKP